MRIAITTLGCKINQYDSAVIQSRLETKHSFVPFGEPADCYVINSCTVTDRADWEARQLVRRAKRLNPAAKVRVHLGVAAGEPARGCRCFRGGLRGRTQSARRPRSFRGNHAGTRDADRCERGETGARRAGAGHASTAGAHARFSQNPRGLQLFLHLLHYSDGAWA